MTNKKYLNSDEAAELITQLGLEFAVVHNSGSEYPPAEIYPLAPRVLTPQNELAAIVMDMDGTTTTTKELCMHSLEFTVRSISGRDTKELWHGLDPIIDYPNLLNNAPENQVRFLVQRYYNFIKPDFLKEAYVNAVLWMLILSHNEDRKKEVRNNLILLGGGEMLSDGKLEEYIVQKEFNRYNSNIITNYFLHKYGERLLLNNFASISVAALAIYYKRYQQLLEIIKYGEGANLSEELLGSSERFLIEPMPAIPLFLCLIKGWLGDDILDLFGDLNEKFKAKNSQVYLIHDIEAARQKLLNLSRIFARKPVKVAIVTSATGYEANIIMTELFNVVSHQIRRWKIPSEKKNFILEKFSDYRKVYDIFITADDVSKIRLKPHRDLYSTVLNKLEIPKQNLHQILGFEDTESGIIAMRASGIGLSVALPYSKNIPQDLSQAAFVLQGGIPEALLNYNLFITQEVQE